MIVWDPQLSGARCAECPLREERVGDPVPSSWPEHPVAIILGEAPGKDEVKKGVPFVGKSGIELEKSLRSLGASRYHVALVNTIACLAPEGDNGLDKLLHRVQKANKVRDAEGRPRIPTPMECCAPRLRQELAALPKVIAVGKRATEAALGHPVKIMSARGGPVNAWLDGAGPEGEALPLRVLPTVHPAFVLRQRRWTGAFRSDLARAFRWFTTGLSWKEPIVLYAPTPRQLRDFLESIATDPYSVVDVETAPGFPEQDHFDPMFDRLRCIGIGVARGYAAVVPFRSVTGQGGGWYNAKEQGEIVDLLRGYLTSSRWRKVTWNGRNYDGPVVRARLGVTITPHLDAIGLHRFAEPELPHDLGYAGSVHTDVDKWKQGHVATSAQTDMELWKYNATDTVVTAQTVEPLYRACAAREQTHLLPIFARLQDVCADLHRNGIYIDQEKRREWDRKLLWQAELKKKEIRGLSGWKDLNPNSFPQIADLLFEKLGVAPHHYTDLGDPSTDDDALRAFLSETWSLDEKALKIVKSIREYRKVVKRRGLVVRLRPITEEYYSEPLVVDLDLDEEEKEDQERRAKKGKSWHAPGLCLPDGRIHSSWLAHGTVGWRFSSNKPNSQNWEDKLRDMATAAPGHVLVACDEAQLELRMVAGLAGCRYYIERFASGDDPHKALCVDTFGGKFEKADKDQQKKLRRSVKELTYSSLYWAGNETKLEIVTSAEDEDEQLLFPDFTLREVGAFTDNWHRRCPEIQVWWESILEEWRRQHFLAEPILGLKCDFLDGEEREKFVNFKPQAGGTALANLALLRVIDSGELPKLQAIMIQHGHDSLMFELPADHGPWKTEIVKGKVVETWCPEVNGKRVCNCRASRLATLLEECMKEDGNKYGLPVPFFGEAKIGRTWKSV